MSQINKWVFAGLGEFIGLIIFTSTEEFYGTNSVADVAQMVGFGLPFALIGFFIGMIFEKFFQ